MNFRKALDWRKALIYTHRWLGIALTAVFVIWFVSGVIFMYVGMPTLPAEERLLRMEPLDVSTIAVSPAEAASTAGLKSPSRVRIAMHDGRPVYRFLSSGTWQAIFADSGAPLTPLTADAAVAVVRRFVPEHATTLRYDTRLTDSDQWTLQGVIRNTMPMHRIALGDPAGTEYYVSERTGEPVLRTTASGRFWGYTSAVLHWLYFTPLRRQGAFWAAFVIGISLVGTVMCAMGIAIGIWRYSLAGRFRLRGVPSSHSPYAAVDAVAPLHGTLLRVLRLHVGVERRVVAGSVHLSRNQSAVAGDARGGNRRASRSHAVDRRTHSRRRGHRATFVSTEGTRLLPVPRRAVFHRLRAAIAVGTSAMEEQRHLGSECAAHRPAARDGVRQASRARTNRVLREEPHVGCGERGHAGRRCRRCDVAQRIRCVLLRSHRDEAAAGAADPIRGSAGDVAISGSAAGHHRVETRTGEPMESLALSRIPQPGFSVSLLQAPAVGHRGHSVEHRRRRDQRHVRAAGVETDRPSEPPDCRDAIPTDPTATRRAPHAAARGGFNCIADCRCPWCWRRGR